MRFERFTLTRFGMFTDEALAFPRPQGENPDLHLVVGPNEAGKSTIRAAFVDLLFGIDARTPYAFQHAYQELLLQAVIHDGGSVEELQRIKGNKNTLRGPGGEILPDGMLMAELQGIDKDGYKRQFALDHVMLVDGGNRLLENESDLSSLLFEAASGIADFAAHQRDLEARAAKLWRRDRRSRTEFRDHVQALQDADRAKRQAVTTGPAYVKLQRELSAAETKRHRAREAHTGLETERRQLERLRIVAPMIARLDRIDRATAELIPTGCTAPRLPADASSRVDQARVQIAMHEETCLRKSQDREGVTRALAELVLDRAILAEAEAIEALTEERARVGDFPDQISRRRIDVRHRESIALDGARQIGWSFDDRSALLDHLPAAHLRSDLQNLVNRRGALAERLTNRTESARGIAEELEAIGDRIAAIPPATISDSLIDAVAEGRKLGDVDRRRDELAGPVERAEGEIVELLSDLRPWSGDLEALAAQRVISPEDLLQTSDRHSDLVGRLEAAQQRVAEITEKLRMKEAEAAARRSQRDIVEKAALDRAREDRESIWQDIRHGRTEVQTAANRYEECVAIADDLADRRFAGAEAIARAEHLDTEVAVLSAEFALAEEVRVRLQEDLENHEATWSGKVDELGLSGITPTRYRDWLQARRSALDADRRRRSLAASLRSFDRRVEATAKTLQESLVADGLDAAAVEGRAFDTLVRMAEARVKDAERISVDLANAEDARKDLDRKRSKADRALKEAEREWAEWSTKWTEALARCNLSLETSTEGVRDALDRMQGIETAMKEIAQIETERIGKMQRDLEMFDARARTCAGVVDPAISAKDGREIARVLSQRLVDARRVEARHDELQRQLQGIDKEISEAGAALGDIHAEMSPLFADAGVPDGIDYEALKLVVHTSDAVRDLERQRTDLDEQLVNAAQGQPIDALRRALEDMPEDARIARAEKLKDDLEDARTDLEEASEHLNEARRALQAVTGGDVDGSDAARAEEDRQQAISALSTIAADYIDTVLQAKLLRWAIDRYRTEHQSPLLARAEELFRVLTLGRYGNLVVDIDASPPVLLAKRGEGDRVALDGLSSGTRDQLFMALRIAAVELQLEQTRPLPFIADDLFINYDDARSAAGFKALADLGRRTQVLYLSHHDHLIDVARAAVGEKVNVVRLQ